MSPKWVAVAPFGVKMAGGDRHGPPGAIGTPPGPKTDQKRPKTMKIALLGPLLGAALKGRLHWLLTSKALLSFKFAIKLRSRRVVCCTKHIIHCILRDVMLGHTRCRRLGNCLGKLIFDQCSLENGVPLGPHGAPWGPHGPHLAVACVSRGARDPWHA